MDVLTKAREVTGIATLHESSRLDDLGLDSLELLEFFHELDMPASAIAKCETLGDCARYLARRAPGEVLA